MIVDEGGIGTVMSCDLLPCVITVLILSEGFPQCSTWWDSDVWPPEINANPAK